MVTSTRRIAFDGSGCVPHHAARAATCRGSSNFFGDRCTHLAAMVAYYALLSFVPLLFLRCSR